MLTSTGSSNSVPSSSRKTGQPGDQIIASEYSNDGDARCRS
jgi:hypothetical protein